MALRFQPHLYLLFLWSLPSMLICALESHCSTPVTWCAASGQHLRLQSGLFVPFFPQTVPESKACLAEGGTHCCAGVQESRKWSTVVWLTCHQHLQQPSCPERQCCIAAAGGQRQPWQDHVWPGTHATAALLFLLYSNDVGKKLRIALSSLMPLLSMMHV